jgi:hypothetical protein
MRQLHATAGISASRTQPPSINGVGELTGIRRPIIWALAYAEKNEIGLYI